MKKIIKQHIGIGNNMVTDGWGAYEWMDANNLGYNRIIHIHGHHDFGYEEESTSHVESVWADLKQKLKSIYIAVKPNIFIYFAKEEEWRKKIFNKSNNEKLNTLMDIFNHIASTTNSELFEKDDIEDFEKEDYVAENDSDNNSSNDNEEEDDEDNLDL